MTHKSQSGTYQAFAIDIGCYAHMRKLHGRFNELDLWHRDAKEKMRSTPILDIQEFNQLWRAAPDDVELALRVEDNEEAAYQAVRHPATHQKAMAPFLVEGAMGNALILCVFEGLGEWRPVLAPRSTLTNIAPLRVEEQAAYLIQGPAGVRMMHRRPRKSAPPRSGGR